MPSTKTIAVAVAALAASSVHASNCKPSATLTSAPTTTTSDVAATTSACDFVELKNDSEIESEELNCEVLGRSKEGDSYTLPSWTREDCGKSCVDYEQFACELISFEAGEEPGIQGSCTLYPDNEVTPAPRGGTVVYYDRKCFRCNTFSGGRGRGGSRFRGRIRRS